MMVPSLFHAPEPTGLSVSHTISGGPPATAIFFSLLLKPNAMCRLSGDQMMLWAPSVPGSARASTLVRSRTQSRVVPSVPLALKATWRPSGDKDT